MLLRLPYARPALSTARWRQPGLERARARPQPRQAHHLRRGNAAASSADGGGAPLHYDPVADLFGPDLDLSPSHYETWDGRERCVQSERKKISNLKNTAPVADKGRLRSWVGPNGQYYRELPCPHCRSRGYTPCRECGIDRSSLDCPMCNGKGIRMCMQCGGECVIWQESIDEQPWEEVQSSSPLKVKEDEEVDKLDIKINTSKRSKRTYPSPSPEVAMKISRSLRSLNAKTGLFTKHMKILHQDAKLHAQRVAAIKRTKGTAAARNHASEKQKAFFRDPENRLKRSIAMKGVKFHCSKCGQEGHRSFYCPTVREISTRVQFRCRLCGEKGHNSRTCGKTKSENEHQRQPRHCSQCGEKGHNRRNCPGSRKVKIGTSAHIIKKVNHHNSGIYSCSFCSEKGHNRRTCPKRNASLG